MSLALGLDTTIYKKFGSKDLINLLSSIGLSETYNEILRFEASGIMHSQTTSFDVISGFYQFVYDNADHNSLTLDRFGSLHIMGLQEFCPPIDLSINTRFKRLEEIPSAEDISQLAAIKIVPYYENPNSKFDDFNLVEKNVCDMTPSHFLWLLNIILLDKETSG